MASNRYANTDVVVDRKTGKRNYGTTIFTSIPKADSDIYIVTRDGDRLDLIAHRVYGDSTLWWIIAITNNLTDSFYLTPGTKLRIPVDIQSATSFISTLNRER